MTPMRCPWRLLLVLFFVCGCHVGFYERQRDREPQARSWIEEHAVSARLDDASIAAIAREVGTAKVVAVGEATHGTHEFAAFRLRLFQALVEHHGFRVFSLEAEFGSMLALDRYASGMEQGNPRELLSRINWVWNTQEMLEVVEWIRTFNRDRPYHDQIRLHGFDAQFPDATLDETCSMLRAAALEAAAEPCRELAALVPSSRSDPPRPEVTEEQLALGMGHVRRLDALVVEHEAGLRARHGDRGFAIARAGVEVVRQGFVLALPQPFDPRDAFMAANVIWIEQLEQKPVFVWAHDAHVTRDIHRRHKNRAIWGDAPMGYHLGQHYAGEDFVAMGTVFTTGSFTALHLRGRLGPVVDVRAMKAARPVRHSFDAVLAEAEAALGPYALDLRRADPGDLEAKWFHTFHITRWLAAMYVPSADRTNVLGGNWWGIVPSQTFDWVVVLGPTTPTTLLEAGAEP